LNGATVAVSRLHVYGAAVFVCVMVRPDA